MPKLLIEIKLDCHLPQELWWGASTLRFHKSSLLKTPHPQRITSLHNFSPPQGLQFLSCHEGGDEVKRSEKYFDNTSPMSSAFLYTFPSSSWIFFVVLTCFWWDVFLWKKVVFLSTYINHSTFNLCFQRTSSSLKSSSNSPSISTFVFVKKLTQGLRWILYSFFQNLLIFWDKFPNLCDPHDRLHSQQLILLFCFLPRSNMVRQRYIYVCSRQDKSLGPDPSHDEYTNILF